jgi:NADPH2:quinone reductase
VGRPRPLPAELKTTFASHYTREISLAEALRLDVIEAYNRKATGEKFLVNPGLG